MNSYTNFLIGAVVVLSACTAGQAQSTEVAKWTFESYTAPAPSLSISGIAKDSGLAAATATASAVHAASTTWSTPVGNGSAKALSSNTWAIGDYYQFSTTLPATYASITVAWDHTGSNTGPGDFAISYSIDGTVFTNIANYVVINDSWSGTTPKTASHYSQTIDISALGAVPQLTFRLTMRSTTAVGSSSTFALTGTSRVDNFTITGESAAATPVSIGGGAVFSASSFGGNPFTAANAATFDGSATVVSLSGAVEAAGLNFVTSGYTLASPTSSDTITLTRPISVDAGATATISGIITGSGGVSKSGEGTLVLSGANTFTGGVTISAGNLVLSNDSVLGASSNGVILNGGVLAPTGSFTLGSGHALSGGGTVSLPASSTLTLAGPVSASVLTVSGASVVNFNNASSSLTGLILPQVTDLNLGVGGLGLAGDLTFNQSSGTSHINGNIGFGSSADRAITVAGGTVIPSGILTIGETAERRLIKFGPGTLDLTSSTLAGASAAVRLGSVGAVASTKDGGILLIDEASDLGSKQMHFNSGTLVATQVIVSPAGVSIGGRAKPDGSPLVPVPVFSGADLTFNGASGFFFNTAVANTDYSDIAFKVNNTTTLAGAIAVTTTTVKSLAPGGTGRLVIAGDASALIDSVFLGDTLTLKVDGQLGITELVVFPGNSLTGSGTIIGNTPDVRPELPFIAFDTVTVQGSLVPSGLLTFKSNLSLVGSTVLDIGGIARGSQYDSIALVNPITDGSVTLGLNLGGSLTLNFTAPASAGTYTLMELGANTAKSNGFSSVALSGNYIGLLTPSGGVWSATISGTTFSFDEATGILTVTGGVSPTTALEDWKIDNFGTATDTPELLIGNTEDFDGDGISNLLEYAFDTDPTVAGASPVITGRAGNFLTLSFPVIADEALTYTVLGSADLTLGFGATTGATVTTGGVSTYTDNVNLSTAGVRRFLRVEVSYTE